MSGSTRNGMAAAAGVIAAIALASAALPTGSAQPPRFATVRGWNGLTWGAGEETVGARLRAIGARCTRDEAHGMFSTGPDARDFGCRSFVRFDCRWSGRQLMIELDGHLLREVRVIERGLTAEVARGRLPRLTQRWGPVSLLVHNPDPTPTWLNPHTELALYVLRNPTGAPDWWATESWRSRSWPPQ